AMMRRSHPDWPESGIAGAMANFEITADGTVAPRLALDRHLAILRAMWEHRPSTRYAGMEVPVLLVPAASRQPSARHAEDKAQAVSAAAAAIPQVRVHWIEGDHDLHAQYPDEVAAVLHQQLAD